MLTDHVGRYYNVNEFAFVTFMWSHGLLPSPAYVRAKDACGWDSFLSNCSQDATHPSLACKAATTEAVAYIPSPIDPYSVLAPTCQDGAGEADAHVVGSSPFLRTLRERHGGGLQYNPCMSRLSAPYMNLPAVLDAVHASDHYRGDWPRTPKGWSYNQGTSGEKADIARLFPRFFADAPDWRIAVVSGTADAAVPFIGTERWMECLGRKVTHDWRKWTIDGQVAGMQKDWAPHLSLITVKGCGHTIPSYCPEAGYAFFANWLEAA